MAGQRVTTIKRVRFAALSREQVVILMRHIDTSVT
jgi:hypothetical protein